MTIGEKWKKVNELAGGDADRVAEILGKLVIALDRAESEARGLGVPFELLAMFDEADEWSCYVHLPHEDVPMRRLEQYASKDKVLTADQFQPGLMRDLLTRCEAENIECFYEAREMPDLHEPGQWPDIEIAILVRPR